MPTSNVAVLPLLSKRWATAEHLERFAPQHFDYVVIDRIPPRKLPTLSGGLA
jgi:hypothetical protein